jgi:hypothetical protein
MFWDDATLAGIYRKWTWDYYTIDETDCDCPNCSTKHFTLRFYDTDEEEFAKYGNYSTPQLAMFAAYFFHSTSHEERNAIIERFQEESGDE